MRIKTIPLALVVAGLCACAAPSPRQWSKPGATQAQFLADRSACIDLAEYRPAPAYAATPGTSAFLENVFLSCMDSRGYKLDPNGKLVAPTGKR
jgi:hypothetical protein